MKLFAFCAADALVTCSPTYAQEIPTLLAKTRMLEPLKQRGITGIVTGIDMDEWNASHSDAPLPYSPATVEIGKRVNKQALQTSLGLRVDPTIPLCGLCSRLVPEKGIDLILEGLEVPLRDGLMQLVVLGVGDSQYREAFTRLQAEMPEWVHYHPVFEMPRARLLYAGCDFTLQPSLTEPCGLNQLISMRYGTLPIVNPVGGLKDTVIDVLRTPDQGSGFVMPVPTAHALHNTVEQATRWLNGDPIQVERTRQHVMQIDWSWRRAAVEYCEIYGRCLGRSL
jgi:starch synthase